MRIIHSSFLILSSLVLVASCAKEIPDSERIDSRTVPSLSMNISIAETGKTSLGEKEKDHYPTLWSEGDAVSINGLKSNVLTSDQAGSNTATFRFEGDLKAPYNILYPASDSSDIVSFPAVQVYREASFDPAAVPMYSVGDGFEDVTLKHLTSVFHFTIRGSGKTLSKVRAFAPSREPLSGDFRMLRDAKGRFTGETECINGKHTVNLDFSGASAALSSTGFEFYMAIPAGKYQSGLSFLLYATDGSVMRLNYKSTENPAVIKASTLIELESQTFSNTSDLVIIGTQEELLSFGKSQSTTSKYLQVDDIDLTGKSWTSSGLRDFMLSRSMPSTGLATRRMRSEHSTWGRRRRSRT